MDEINLICEKLGTTINSLIPAVIEYETHSIQIGIIIAPILIAIGIVLAIIGVWRDHKAPYNDDTVILYFISACFIIAGTILLSINLYENYMLNKVPDIYAIKTILEWLGS